MNRMIRRVGLLSLCFWLAACATAPSGVQYYVLNSSASSHAAEAGNSKQSLLIESVELADFLKQSGMVMQTGEHRMHLSKSHLWAERLNESVPKALQKQLQTQSGEHVVYLKGNDWSNDPDYTLRLRLDNLQATHRGEVLTSGRYQLIAQSGSVKGLVRDFHFTADLDEDGYSHAVGEMEALIALIAEDVISNLSSEALKK